MATTVSLDGAAPALPAIRNITTHDLFDALSKGIEDAKAKPSFVPFVIVIYPLVSVLTIMVAFNYANMAMDLVAEGMSGRMVALQGGTYTHIPLSSIMGGLKRVDVPELYDVDEYRPKVRHVLGKPMFLY